MADGAELLVSVEGPVGVLTINRPERRNAINPGLLTALARSLGELAGRDELRCVVLRGAGDEAFSAGMDLKEFASGGLSAVEESIRPGGLLARFLDALEGCPLPVIASIEGWCLGAGCEMSMACDLRVGSEGCRTGMPPAGLQSFLRAVGPARTRKVFLAAAGLKRSLYHLTRPAHLASEAELEMEALQGTPFKSRDAVVSLEAFTQKRDLDFKGE